MKQIYLNAFLISIVSTSLLAACGGSKELEEIPKTPLELMEMRVDSVITLQNTALERARVAEDALQNAGNKRQFQDAFLESFNGSADKITQLSEVLTESADWRPAEGVRSVQEAILHLTTANFFLASKFGAELPIDLDLDTFESETESMKDAVTAMKRSFELVRRAAASISTSELNEEVVLFGENKGPKSKAMMIVLDHMNEHQGQLIAYARINEIVPPWSR